MKNLTDITFWKTEGINYYRWQGAPVYHEGEDNVDAIAKFVGNKSLRDVGCGYGRLATKFKPEQYVGFELCEAAVKKAQRLFPEYRFIHWNFEPLPFAEATIFINGPRLVDHQDIDELLALLCADTNTLILGETMEIDSVDHTDWNVYPRTLETYVALLEKQGFNLTDTYTSVHKWLAPLPYTVARWDK